MKAAGVEFAGPRRETATAVRLEMYRERERKKKGGISVYIRCPFASYIKYKYTTAAAPVIYRQLALKAYTSRRYTTPLFHRTHSTTGCYRPLRLDSPNFLPFFSFFLSFYFFFFHTKRGRRKETRY